MLIFGCKSKDRRGHVNIQRMSVIKSILSGEDDEFLKALEKRDSSKLKWYAEEYGFSSEIFGGTFMTIWKDAWGNAYRVKYSNDLTLILLSSDGPNRKFDDYDYDDILVIIDRK